MSKNLNKITFFGAQNWDWLFASMAKIFKKNYGASSDIFCNSEQTRQVYLKRWPSIFDNIITMYNHYDLLDKKITDESAILEEAKKNEEKYNILIMDIIQSDRHLGRGFMWGGPFHPRSWRSHRGTYIQSIRLVNHLLDYFDKYFDKTRPDFIVARGIGEVLGKSWAVVARNRGIPIRNLAPSRYKDFWCWTENEFQEVYRIEQEFKQIKADNFFEESWTLHADTSLIHDRIAQFKKIHIMLYRAILATLKHFYSKIRRYDKAKGYFLYDTLRYIFLIWKEFHELDKLKLYTSMELKGKLFFFFPLHVEPESALMSLSPEFNDQIAIILMVAKNLPAGVKLAIKEHKTAVGRRPSGFYHQLVDIPNVILISPFEKATELIHDSLGVIVLSSTAGFEASIMGKPVITFSFHNTYNILPHVNVVHDWSMIRNHLTSCIKSLSPKEEKKRKMDGMRFLQAVKNVSFDVSDLNIYQSNYTKIPTKASDRFINSLFDSLEKDNIVSHQREMENNVFKKVEALCSTIQAS